MEWSRGFVFLEREGTWEWCALGRYLYFQNKGAYTLRRGVSLGTWGVPLEFSQPRTHRLRVKVARKSHSLQLTSLNYFIIKLNPARCLGSPGSAAHAGPTAHPEVEHSWQTRGPASGPH